MCGIAGGYNTSDAVQLTKLGLYMQQHRGQEWAGIVSSDGVNFYPKDAPFRARGLVMEALDQDIMNGMMGTMAMGHVRYSTQGSSELSNAQPHHAQTTAGRIFFASNGDIVNCHLLREELQRHEIDFYSQNDGEVIVKLIGHLYGVHGNWIDAIREAKQKLNGSYSGVLMTSDRIFLIRDHLENRPFCYTVGEDGAVLFASESCALDTMTARHRGFPDHRYDFREVRGNEIIELAQGKVMSHPDPPQANSRAHCIFEMIYFARPDSIVFGMQVKEFRKKLARALVHETPLTGDLVAGVPDSASEAAIEISKTTGIPHENVLYRHHYTGRTFIAPSQVMRDYSVQLKFNPDRIIIPGKEIILIDDSIVRGSTMRKIVGMIKNYGPKRLTVLSTCPLIMHPCYYGIDMKNSLIADEEHGRIEAIKERIGLDEDDRLYFLSLDGLRSCVPDDARWCFACLSGEYPTDVTEYVAPTEAP